MNGKGISCVAIERNLTGLECSMPRPHERLVFMWVLLFLLCPHCPLLFHFQDVS